MLVLSQAESGRGTAGLKEGGTVGYTPIVIAIPGLVHRAGCGCAAPKARCLAEYAAPACPSGRPGGPGAARIRRPGSGFPFSVQGNWRDRQSGRGDNGRRFHGSG